MQEIFASNPDKKKSIALQTRLGNDISNEQYFEFTLP